MEALFPGKCCMEASHGCVSPRGPAFLSCRGPRSPQSARTAAPPLRHPRLGLLCHHVGRQSSAAIGQWGQDQDIALMHQLGFTRRPPKAGGIRKVLIALDVMAFEAVLTRWAEANLSQPIRPRPAPPEAFALDGKSVRGSFDGLEKRRAPALPDGPRSGLTLAQVAVPHGVEDKTNEHKTALRLLDGVDLRGAWSPATPSSASATSPSRSSTPRGTSCGSSRRTNRPSCRTRGGLRPFGGRGFFPLGSGGSGRRRWRPRRRSTRGTAGANGGR